MGIILIRSINNNRIYIFLFLLLFFIFFYLNFPKSFSTSNYYDSIVHSRGYGRSFQSPENHENFRHNEDDQHVQAPQSVVAMTPKRTHYPKRLNMGACPPLFGKVTVFVAVVESSYKT